MVCDSRRNGFYIDLFDLNSVNQLKIRYEHE